MHLVDDEHRQVVGDRRAIGAELDANRGAERRVQQSAVVGRHAGAGMPAAASLGAPAEKIRDSFAASSAAGRACR